MQYKATKSFKGIISMEAEEVRDLEYNALIVKDLVRAGWLKKVDELKKAKDKK